MSGTYNATLTGLSTIRRSGTTTVDTVTDWYFLYANMAVGSLVVRNWNEYLPYILKTIFHHLLSWSTLQANYPGIVQEGEVTDTFSATLSLEIVDIYMTARADSFDKIFDIDQFVVSELGYE